MRARNTLLSLTILLAGCAQPTDERSAVVSGKVTLGSSPVIAGTVLMMTDDGHAATAELASDGKYSLRCRPARYKVAVTPPPPADPLVAAPAAASPPSDRGIPKRYHDFGTSGLTVEAKAGDNTYDIGLSP